MRRVVLLPQPDGPTRTTSSLSGMSRLTLRTASTSSKRLMTLRSATSAMLTSALGGAGGEPGDIIIHQECINDERRCRGSERAGHEHAPFVDVGPDQARDRADSENLLVGRIEKRH